MSRGDHDVHGLLGGVQGGCDFQFAGGFVVGIQGDYAWTDAEGSHIIDPLVGDATIQTKIKSLATVTGRIGYSWDRLLGYVKGGGAWERDNYDVFEPTTLVTLALASETRSGWTIGIGGEYAFSNFISGFLEYNYYDFGNRDITFVTPSGETSNTLDIKETKSVVRAGFNLKFGGGKAPSRSEILTAREVYASVLSLPSLRLLCASSLKSLSLRARSQVLPGGRIRASRSCALEL